MILKVKNVCPSIFLIVIGLLFVGFIVRDFSYKRNVEKSYYGVLYAEENGRLRELESGAMQMTGTLNSNRHGRRIYNGTFDIDLGEFIGQVRFVTHANSYDRRLKWYIALLTAGEMDFDPIEIGRYTSSTLCFSRNLTAIGMLLECNGNCFFLIAAEEKEGLPGAETVVLESIRER